MKALILAALVVLAGCDPAQNTVPQLVKCQPGATDHDRGNVLAVSSAAARAASYAEEHQTEYARTGDGVREALRYGWLAGWQDANARPNWLKSAWRVVRALVREFDP